MKNILVFMLIVLGTISIYGQQISGRLLWNDNLSIMNQKNFDLPSSPGSHAPSGFVVCEGPSLNSLMLSYSVIKEGNKFLFVSDDIKVSTDDLLRYSYKGQKQIRLSEFNASTRLEITQISAKVTITYKGQSVETGLVGLEKNAPQNISNECATLGVKDDISGLSLSNLRVTYYKLNMNELVEIFKPYFFNNIYQPPTKKTEQTQKPNTADERTNQSSGTSPASDRTEQTTSSRSSHTTADTHRPADRPSQTHTHQSTYQDDRRDLDREKDQIVQQAMYDINQIDKVYEERQRMLSDGMGDIATAFTPGVDKSDQVKAAMLGTAKVMSSLGANPFVSIGAVTVIALIAGNSKSAEEIEAEKVRKENERLLEEYYSVLYDAEEKLRHADNSERYNFNFYKNARDEYAKVINHKFANEYPGEMVSKIDYYMETQRIKEVMWNFANEVNTEYNRNYMSERRDKIYFYFTTIELEPANRRAYLKTSNIFTVYFDSNMNRWPYAPEITNNIKRRHGDVIIKGYFRTFDNAVNHRKELINKASKNFYIPNTDHYKFNFGNMPSSSQKVSSQGNTDFWGNVIESEQTNENEETPENVETELDFWGNPVKSETPKTETTTEEQENQEPELDFWGNPIKKP